MTNFDNFHTEPMFASFAKVAVSAEKILNIAPAACVLNCRRAMEITNLVAQPYNSKLSSRVLSTKNGICLTA